MQANLPAILAFALLVAVSLSGCLGDIASETSDTGDSGGDASDGGNQTADGGNQTGDGGSGADPATSPPVATIGVSGDNVTANGSTFVFAEGASVTLDASNSTDPAGGALTFSWDFSDGETAEGAVVSRNFTAGNYTVDLTATSDASGRSSSARATLQVLEPHQDVGTVEPQTFSETVDVFCQQCYYVGKDASVSYTTGVDGIDSAWIEFGPGFDGLPFTATGPGDADIFFHAGCDGEELEWFDSEGNEEGIVPAGATCGWVYDFAEMGAIDLVIG